MSKNTKKKLAAVMFCKFDGYDKYVSNDKKVAAKILSDYEIQLFSNTSRLL